MAVMIVVVLVATFCRYTQLAVLNWPDELTRYLMVWMVFIGAGAASKYKSHFEITAVYEKLAPVGQLIMLTVKVIVCCALYIFMIKTGVTLVGNLMAMGQKSPAMHVPMWFMYLAIPTGFALMMIQGLITDAAQFSGLINKIKGKGEKAE